MCPNQGSNLQPFGVQDGCSNQLSHLARDRRNHFWKFIYPKYLKEDYLENNRIKLHPCKQRSDQFYLHLKTWSFFIKNQKSWTEVIPCSLSLGKGAASSLPSTPLEVHKRERKWVKPKGLTSHGSSVSWALSRWNSSSGRSNWSSGKNVESCSGARCPGPGGWAFLSVPVSAQVQRVHPYWALLWALQVFDRRWSPLNFVVPMAFLVN